MKKGKLFVVLSAVCITAISVIAFLVASDASERKSDSPQRNDHGKETPAALIKVKPTPPPKFLSK